MKKLLLSPFIILLILTAFAGKTYAQVTYDWTGAATSGSKNAWNNSGNWNIGATQQTTSYPGDPGRAGSATDIVKIGINYSYTGSNYPQLLNYLTVTVASLNVGDNTNINASTQVYNYLYIAGTLNVTGTFTQQHSNNIGFAGNGAPGYPLNYDFVVHTYIWGAGFLNVGTFQVGDSTLPPTGISNVTRINLSAPGYTPCPTIKVTGDFIINSYSGNDTGTGQVNALNNAEVSYNGGTTNSANGNLTIGGTLRLTNTGVSGYDPLNYNSSQTQFQPHAWFSMQSYNNGYYTTLNLQGANPLASTPANGSGQIGNNIFDFFNIDRATMAAAGSPISLPNLDKAIVNYNGTGSQEVYTSASFANGVIDQDGGSYEYLSFGGTGTKTIDATNFPMVISGDMTLNTGSETVNLSTNNPTITFNNNNVVFSSYGSGSSPVNFLYTIPIASSFISNTGSTFQNGSVALTIPGTTSNGGTFNTGAAALTLSGALTNSGTFNQTGAGTVTASTTTSNTGTYNQNGSGALTFTGALTNSGTFNELSSGTVTANNTVSNPGTFNQSGTGAITFNNTVDNSGTFSDSNTGAINFNSSLTNSATTSVFNQSNGTINLNYSYTNNGKFAATGGVVNLNQAGTQTLTDNSAANKGTTFFTLNVQNGGSETMTGTAPGQFHIASQGTINMIANTSLASNGFLTLNSDVNGTATLTNVPTSCNITGAVTVQRYVSANRAYRLVSSPVYTNNDGTNNIYGVNYLETNTYLTGSGGGFDKTGNPTLYLYRENLAPLYTTFLNSNFRGISDISGTPYGMNDASYPTANIPVGNGYLFYYRGSRKQASLATLTTAGAAATTDTLNAVGILNIGNVSVHDWYTPTSPNLGYTTVSGDPTVEGFNLVGNPYASSIDWDQYGSGINQTQVAAFSYKLIPSGLQGSGNYDVYTAGTPSKTGTQGTANANIIASGEGFFVQAIDATATLTFTEAAKSNTYVTGASLYMAKSVVNVTPQYLRLQLALDSINTDGMIVNFGDGYKTTFDPKEDARYKVGTGKVSLSSMSSDNVALAINQMPLSGKTVTVPLKISATANGTYTLNMKALSGIPTLYDVFLKDAYTKDSVNMRNVKSYSFTIALTDTNSFGKTRFSLVLTQDAALAYQLVNFNASKANNGSQVEVVWNTVNEANYTHFTVERSTDGGNTYETIGGLTADSQGAYSILDKSPLNGANLYRLKQEDFNNVITYSNVVQIAFTPKANNQLNSALSVYPNPVASNITLTIDPKTAAAGSYHIRITNNTGLVVRQVVTTQTTWQENLSNLFSGTYIVQVINDKDNTLVGQTKFVKL